QQA
ncbi:hypothetical protein VCHC55C2_1644B, partial [Vibrio cholerae HC-55C2]